LLVANDLQSFDSCVVEIDFSLFASFYNLYVPLFIEDFEVSSDFFGSSYLVIPTNFDEIPIELESKVVHAKNKLLKTLLSSNDTLCLHNIVLF